MRSPTCASPASTRTSRTPLTSSASSTTSAPPCARPPRPSHAPTQPRGNRPARPSAFCDRDLELLAHLQAAAVQVVVTHDLVDHLPRVAAGRDLASDRPERVTGLD